MRTVRRGRVAFGVALGLAAALLPVSLAAPPASADHPGGSFLQVMPEVSSVQVGTTVTLTARLYGALLLGRTDPTVLQPVQVNFAFVGGPLGGSAPLGCTVPTGVLTPAVCSVDVAASTAGTTLVRAWVEGHAADTTEGRLASAAAASSTAADCLGTDEQDIDAAVCLTGDAVTAGGTAESDTTDVVRVTWSDRGLDVTPDNLTRALGETATLTAAVNDLAGNAAAGVEVKFEFADGSVSDPGGGSTPGVPDRRCTTNASGTCTVAFTQSSSGTDVLCAWTSANAPAMTGKAGETVTCDGEVQFDTSSNDGRPSPLDDDIDVVRVQWGTAAPTTTTMPGAGPPPPGNGYWLVAADGGIFAFGDTVFHGSTGALRLNQPIVGMAHTPSRKGYFLVAADGGIFAFGDAVFRGSTGAIRLARPIVGMAATPSGNGYFLVAADGGVFAFGDAVFRGSTGALRLNQPIVAMAVTPSGKGYFLVAADGGVFAFGDAVFRGSTGAIRLARPIVGMAATPSGNGYFLVAADGGIFAFGDAVFRGSTGGQRLAQPIVGMSRSASGGGYRLVARDGGVFAFGDAVFRGSTGGIGLNQPMVGMAGF